MERFDPVQGVGDVLGFDVWNACGFSSDFCACCWWLAGRAGRESLVLPVRAGAWCWASTASCSRRPGSATEDISRSHCAAVRIRDSTIVPKTLLSGWTIAASTITGGRSLRNRNPTAPVSRSLSRTWCGAARLNPSPSSHALHSRFVGHPWKCPRDPDSAPQPAKSSPAQVNGLRAPRTRLGSRAPQPRVRSESRSCQVGEPGSRARFGSEVPVLVCDAVCAVSATSAASSHTRPRLDGLTAHAVQQPEVAGTCAA